MIRGYIYRFVMRVAHKYHWHYAPPIYPEGDTHLWCKWCGFRETIKVNPNKNFVSGVGSEAAEIKRMRGGE